MYVPTGGLAITGGARRSTTTPALARPAPPALARPAPARPGPARPAPAGPAPATVPQTRR
jgi:hypothetical protein